MRRQAWCAIAAACIVGRAEGATAAHQVDERVAISYELGAGSTYQYRVLGCDALGWMPEESRPVVGGIRVTLGDFVGSAGEGAYYYADTSKWYDRERDSYRVDITGSLSFDPYHLNQGISLWTSAEALRSGHLWLSHSGTPPWSNDGDAELDGISALGCVECSFQLVLDLAYVGFDEYGFVTLH